ncbi:MAG: flagellar filament capping protein FliD [Spirochaetales bacterium]|nr:flagellar filament capping protein FliD [Spirochaetales bacterium]
MSDFVIPGVTSKIDTKGMVKALVDVKRTKLENLENDVKEYQKTQEVWRDLNVKMTRLKESAKELYGFDNPFNEKIAQSSRPEILTATATREAFEMKKKILVKQVATVDRFMSASLDKDFKVPGGNYQFKVGEDEVSLRFTGGTVNQFASAITAKSKGLLNAYTVNDTSKTQVMMIETTKTGSKNRLSFLGDTVKVALDLGLIERSRSAAKEISFLQNPPQKWDNELDSKLFSIQDKRLDLKPGAQMRLPFGENLEITKDSILEMEITIEDIPEKAPPPLGDGPVYPKVGEISFKGITIENEPSQVILDDIKAPEPPPKVEAPEVLFAGNGPQSKALPKIDLSEGKRTIQISIGEYLNSMDSLLLKNDNTHKNISIENVKIYDPAARGDFKPKNAVTEAGDAILEMDGVTITRENNEIDDLLPGVNLTLHEASDQKVNLDIKRDIDKIVSSVVEFVGNYNNTLTYIDVLSRNDERVLDDLQHLEEDEMEKNKERLGQLQGDITLMQIRRSLANTMMSPYRTREGSDLSMLTQLGISTTAGKPGSFGSVDTNRLRGYLEIDDEILAEALGRFPDGIKDFFGMDSDGDLVVDSGLGFTLDYQIKPYTETGGILTMKNDSFEKRIDTKKDEIDDYNEYLKDYEAQMKRKYAMMEGALEQMNQNSTAIENFSTQQKNSQ